MAMNLTTEPANLLTVGGAIALIDSVFLPLHISGVTFKTITYGMPRVCIIS